MPGDSLHGLVARAAATNPDALAVVDEAHSLTYRELECASDELAAELRALGCGQGDLVCILAPKSSRAIVAILATLKCGAAYVPLDHASPPPRLGKMLIAASPRVLIAHPDCAELLKECLTRYDPAVPPSVQWLRETTLNDTMRTSAPLSHSPGDLAYVMFTSGSTGVPKGVPITHGSATNFVSWAMDHFGIGPGLRISCHPPLHFDISVMDIFGALGAGAELHLVPDRVNLAPELTANFIRGARLNQWFSVPAVLAAMAGRNIIDYGDFPDLRRVVWCGDVLRTPVLRHWMQRLPQVSFTNLYGPTEATIACSFYDIRRIPENDFTPIPIGRPITGVHMSVRDDHGCAAPPGAIGNLYIGGDCLTPGYLGNPENDTQAFQDLPGSDLGRWYRTGDLACIDEDGIFSFHGRMDRQIKSRGYRIELDEIAAALSGLPEVAEAATVAIASPGIQGKEICAAYTARPGSETSPRKIRSQLAHILPLYMVPMRLLCLPALPVNPNGKVDYNSLSQRFLEIDPRRYGSTTRRNDGGLGGLGDRFNMADLVRRPSP
jgi:amino acid adenylation domain-containing protein